MAVTNAVDNQATHVDLVRILEAWGLGPEMHLSAVLSWVLRAHQATAKDARLVALDQALWYLTRAVDNHNEKPLDANPNALAQTLAAWGLTGRLRDAVTALSQGKWTSAHLILTCAREQSGG